MFEICIRELINSYYGIGSAYHDALLTPGIKPDILAFYLYKTVGVRNLKEFNASLDVLCGYLDQVHILPATRNNILRSLKLLNDLTFDHPIKAQDDNIFSAQEFYFARYPRVDTTQHDFKLELPRHLLVFVNIFIQKKLKLQVKFTDWCLFQFPDLKLEPTTSWRHALKLPADQCPTTQADTGMLILPGPRRVRFSESISTTSVQSLNVSPSSSVSASTQSLPTIARGRSQCTG